MQRETRLDCVAVATGSPQDEFVRYAAGRIRSIGERANQWPAPTAELARLLCHADLLRRSAAKREILPTQVAHRPVAKASIVTSQLGIARRAEPSRCLRMTEAVRLFWSIGLLLGALLLTGCETVPEGIQQAKIEMARKIATEPGGDYYIGRRYYKPDFKFWGYVRRPGQPWSGAVLVMLNEKQKLAPDRAELRFGYDNNYEYRLYGYFSGDKVYEPASNNVYPEFVLKSYELISTNPPPIFKSQYSGSAETAQTRYSIERPE
jgi:hypothetical protein